MILGRFPLGSVPLGFGAPFPWPYPPTPPVPPPPPPWVPQPPYLPWGPDARFFSLGGHESFALSSAFINSAEGPPWGGDVDFAATATHQLFPRIRTRQKLTTMIGFKKFPIREPE